MSREQIVIPPSDVPLSEVAAILEEQAYDVLKGSVFILTTNLIERGRTGSSLSFAADDSILQRRYIGQASLPFVTLFEEQNLTLNTLRFYDVASDTVETGALKLVPHSRKYTDPHVPIPERYVAMRHEKEAYPFSLVTARSGEDLWYTLSYEFPEGKPHDIVEALVRAWRLLDLPGTRPPALIQADSQVVTELVEALYSKWSIVCLEYYYLLGRLLKSHKHNPQERVEKVRSSVQQLFERDVLFPRIRNTLDELKYLGVYEEERVLQMHSVPGLTLNVPVFLRFLSDIFRDCV
jgi:hypothetical protein